MGIRPREGDQRLHELGLKVIGDRDDPEARAECVRVAKRIRSSRLRTVGLLPASPKTGVPGIALQIGVGLAELSGATVGIVDANVRWPAFTDLAASAYDQRSESDSAFTTTWLRGSLALLAPPCAMTAGAGVAELQRLLDKGAGLFGHLLVDLTGFELIGVHLDAIRLLDGAVIVGSVGVTSDWDLLRLDKQIPPWKKLGVLLVG